MITHLAQLFALDIFSIEINPGSIALFVIALVSPLVLLILVALDTELRKRGVVGSVKEIRSVYGIKTAVGVLVVFASLVLIIVSFLGSI